MIRTVVKRGYALNPVVDMNRLVVCSHGTRSAVGAARITALVAAVADALPSVEVREAHVDVHPPYLEDVLTPGRSSYRSCSRRATTSRPTSPVPRLGTVPR